MFGDGEGEKMIEGEGEEEKIEGEGEEEPNRFGPGDGDVASSSREFK